MDERDMKGKGTMKGKESFKFADLRGKKGIQVGEGHQPDRGSIDGKLAGDADAASRSPDHSPNCKALPSGFACICGHEERTPALPKFNMDRAGQSVAQLIQRLQAHERRIQQSVLTGPPRVNFPGEMYDMTILNMRAIMAVLDLVVYLATGKAVLKDMTKQDRDNGDHEGDRGNGPDREGVRE